MTKTNVKSKLTTVIDTEGRRRWLADHDAWRVAGALAPGATLVGFRGSHLLTINRFVALLGFEEVMRAAKGSAGQHASAQGAWRHFFDTCRTQIRALTAGAEGARP